MRPRARETIHGSHVGTEAPAPFALPPAPEWMRDALCAQTGPEDDRWFPEGSGRQGAEAKAACALCPLTGQDGPCFARALANDEHWGYWGGVNFARLSAADRTRLRAGAHVPDPPHASVCGTPRGYWRHKERHETTCQDCRTAVAAYERDRRHKGGAA